MAARRPTQIQLNVLTERYELGTYLASGGCGTVMMCHKKGDPNKKFVLKYMNLNELSKNKAAGAKREAELMSELNHPNLVTLHDVFECDGKLHLVIEHCDGGDLRERITYKKLKKMDFPYPVVRRWMIQLTEGIKALHQAKIIHRDIKPENIFLTGETDEIRIGDLGISRKIEENQRAKTRIGTPRYVSPELMDGTPYSFETDIWSLGVMLIEICTLRRVMIKPTRRARKFLCIKCGEKISVEIPPIPEKYGYELMTIARKMLKKDPAKRPTAPELLEMLTNLPTSVTN